jgi:hypothetical protein
MVRGYAAGDAGIRSKAAREIEDSFRRLAKTAGIVVGAKPTAWWSR